MDVDHRVQEIIEGAEKALAALAAEAASERDYPKASMLLGLAQRVAGTLRPGMGSKQAAQSIPAAKGAQSPTIAPATLKASATAGTGKKAGSQYPHFKREDDALIKVGWSKSDRATYEHRSPRGILDRLVLKIAEAGSSGERFTTEQILPLLADDDTELPSYQAYLCLAWLVVAGLLERHGRQGYTICVDGDFQQSVEAQWEQLPGR